MKGKNATGRTRAPELSLGVTQLTLVVTDQFCNKASETATVTVILSTVPGTYCYYYNFLDSEPALVPLPELVSPNTKPMFAETVNAINFETRALFGKYKFNENSFAVRCAYSINVKTAGSTNY